MNFTSVFPSFLAVGIVLLATQFCDRPAYAIDIAETLKLLDSPNPSIQRKAIGTLRALDSSQLSAIRRLDGTLLLSARAWKLQKCIFSEKVFTQYSLPAVDPANFQEKKIKGSTLRFNREKKTIMIPAEFKLERGMLEYLVVSEGPNSPVHETVLTTTAKGSDICLAMLACGYEALENELPSEGGLLRANSGVYISIQFEFEKPHDGMAVISGDADRVRLEDPKHVSVIRVPIECFAYNSMTQQPMRRVPFLFTGSFFVRNSSQPEASIFAADLEGPIVALKTNLAALMNTALNTRDVDPQKRAGYSIDRFVIPERGRKCFLVLEPCEERTLSREDLDDSQK